MEVVTKILVYIEAVEGLSEIFGTIPKNPRSQKKIMGLTSDLASSPDTSEFLSACTHFYSMPKTQSVPALISALENLNPQIMESAAVLLGVLHDPRAINPLIRAFKSKHLPVTDQLMRTLFWFGKRSVPGLYEAFISTESYKIRRDSLATISLISNYAPKNYIGAHRLFTGKALTIEEYRGTLEYLSARDLQEFREVSESLSSEIEEGETRKSFFLANLDLFSDDEGIAFIEKQIKKEVISKCDEKLPRPKVFRPDFSCSRNKKALPDNTPKKPVTVLSTRRKNPNK